MSQNRRKHFELVRALKELVQGQAVGARLSNDRDLAKAYGVSNVTLRAAMLELQGEGLVERRVGAGTFVADRSSRQHVAVVVPHELIHAHRMPYALTLTMSVLDELNHTGLSYKLYIVPRVLNGRVCRPWPQAEHVQQCGLADAISGNLIRGAILIGLGTTSGWAAELMEQGVPIIGSRSDVNLKYRYGFDYESSLNKGLKYLINHGRRRIALLSWRHYDPRLNRPDTILELFKSTLDAASCEIRDEWIRCDANPMNPSSGWEAFREIWSAYSDAKPDAILVQDDRLFSGASSAILEAGINVPRDLQVVSHWNRGSGIFCSFPIARSQFDPAELGRQVSRLMERCLNEPDLDPHDEILKSVWFDEGDYETANEIDSGQSELSLALNTVPENLHS